MHHSYHYRCPHEELGAKVNNMFETHEEIFKALMEGKKLRCKSWDEGNYVSLVNGMLKDNEDLDFTPFFAELSLCDFK